MAGSAQTTHECAAARLREAMDRYIIEETKEADGALVPEELDHLLWEALMVFQDQVFCTAKGLEFTYYIKGNEMFVDRKDKSITRATAVLSVQRAAALRRKGLAVSGPKKLGTFGASYLFPVFQRMGLIL